MKKDIEKLNQIIEDYINYLDRCNPQFLNNAMFFFELTASDKRISIEMDNYEFKKMNATDSLKIVKEFIEKYYKENLKEIDDLLNNGNINIYYLDELEKEKIYIELKEKKFAQNKNEIRLPLKSTSLDISCIIHEIRHQLNQPVNNRNEDNNMLTEGLSIFDELLMFDFLNDKLDITESNNIKKKTLKVLLSEFEYVNFICKLIIIKDKLSYINLENYEILFGKEDLENDIKNVNIFLKTHDSYKDIDAHIQNWYTFGIFIASFMHQKYLEDETYLDKFKLLNERVRNNYNIIESLKAVDIDLNSGNIINELKESLIAEIKTLNIEKKM